MPARSVFTFPPADSLAHQVMLMVVVDVDVDVDMDMDMDVDVCVMGDRA